jgi:hypothetical protein
MILFIIKKVTAIYKVNKLFFLLVLFSSFAFSQNTIDLNSYCFEKNVSLKEVHQSLTVFLLPKDIVQYRTGDNCLDIATSIERGVVFEKYLSKRFHLISELRKEMTNECRINLKTTKKLKANSTKVNIGLLNNVNSNEITNSSSSIMEILLGTKEAAEIEVGSEKLNVLCRLHGENNGSLIFSYIDKEKASVKSEVSVRKGEWMNVASVINELASKTKALGIPQTEFNKINENNETIYEIQLK